MTGVQTCALPIYSAVHHGEGRLDKASKTLYAAIALGLTFLTIQMYEYSNSGFLWGDHPYGTAFFSLTGLHGLHVLIGLLVFIVVAALMRNGHMPADRHDGYRAVTMYWHFVDAVWIVLFLVVYLEVI